MANNDRVRSGSVPVCNHTMNVIMGRSRSIPPFALKSRRAVTLGPNLSHLKPSVTLPPEILDKILEHIPTNREGRPTLIACTLVATWWTGPSQRRLFSSIEIGKVNFQRWMDGVVLSGSKTRLECVRSLYCHGYFGIKHRMGDLPQDCGEYFSALRNLHRLTLLNTTAEHISEEGFHTCFSAFRETLTYLSLNTFTASFSAFVTLIGYFPNVTSLELDSFVLEPDEGPVPSLSWPLWGKLLILYVQADFLEFLDRFVKLDLRYEELLIDCSYTVEERPLERVLQISPSTVKFLRLVGELERKWPLPVPLIKPTSLPNSVVVKLKPR